MGQTDLLCGAWLSPSRDESAADFSELQPYYGTSTRQKVIPVGIGSETV